MKPAIRIENLSKQYRLGLVGTGTLSHDLKRWWHLIRGKEDPYLKIGETNDRATKGNSQYVWALKDINLEVMPGEVLGIIGKNGAGKSTLLKILSKVTGPTTGTIDYKGRIGSLLEVGTGFHPELTGRENIYLNGAILGMRKKEIDRKFDEIVDFSGVERYIDTPTKRYSSGMTVRLGFAVAAFLEPEILVVDEVLAVGDAEFQKKAIGKMQDVSKNDGRTVLFVSHNMGAIANLCNSAVLLKNGSVLYQEKTDYVIGKYLETTYQSNTSIEYELDYKKKGQLLFADIRNNNGHLSNRFKAGENFILHLRYKLNINISNFHVAFILYDSLGNHIFSSADTDLSPQFLGNRKPGIYEVSVEVPTYNLNTGQYHLVAGIGMIGIENFDRKELFSIKIEDLGDFGTGKEGSRRKGIVLIKCIWNYHGNR